MSADRANWPNRCQHVGMAALTPRLSERIRRDFLLAQPRQWPVTWRPWTRELLAARIASGSRPRSFLPQPANGTASCLSSACCGWTGVMSLEPEDSPTRTDPPGWRRNCLALRLTHDAHHHHVSVRRFSSSGLCDGFAAPAHQGALDRWDLDGRKGLAASTSMSELSEAIGRPTLGANVADVCHAGSRSGIVIVDLII